ncbi:hypothetical protein NPIL_153451 [Nephila pilipes]|uniref:Uncharacterized protein n=1 Tax=Nephila pilipes TaxID=299642 RepID=A0A8X6U4E4_NEPPI|nr:hypothetical protein NPIL_153451 [Nephila pilipes]
MASNIDSESEAWATIFWNIENFIYCYHKIGECIPSPEFKVESEENLSWRLQLFPRGVFIDEFISFLLFGDYENSSSIGIKGEFAFLAEDGSVLQSKAKEKTIEEKECCVGFELFLKREDVMETEREIYLSGGTLRTRCRLWRTDGKAVTPTMHSARTTLRVKKRNFLWDIERFNFLKTGDKIDFVVRSESKDTVAIFNIGVNDEDVIWISTMSFKEDVKSLIFQPFITDVNGSRIDCGKCKVEPNEIKKVVIITLPFTKQYLVENKNLYMKNDVLTLHFECSWCNGYAFGGIVETNFGIAPLSNAIFHKACTPKVAIDQPDSMDDLKEDFISLWTKGELSDVELLTTTRTIPAHKAFLCARSRVFKVIFTSDGQKSTDSVVVSHLDYDTAYRMLMYVYTNSLDGLQWESAIKLYAAADKFEIIPLRRRCSSFLNNNLSPSNLYEVFHLAHLCDDFDLLTIAQEYALAHEEEVFHSEQWKEFTKNNAIVAAETMLLKWIKS